VNVTIYALLVDAAALWRRERRLVVPVAGVFFFLPMLAIVLLVARIDVPQSATAEEMRAAIAAFYNAHYGAILAINLVLDFGGFALLNLFLQGNGRTLGEVLSISLRRFLPVVAINLIAGLAFGLGASLFLLPGLYLFGRTWLAAPAYAARPEQGMIGALGEGWKLSGGLAWLGLLTLAAVALLAGLALLLFSLLPVVMAAAAFDDAPAVRMVADAAVAAVGAVTWSALAILRVAAYRALAARQGT
jgi:hypothetical protein